MQRYKLASSLKPKANTQHLMCCYITVNLSRISRLHLNIDIRCISQGSSAENIHSRIFLLKQNTVLTIHSIVKTKSVQLLYHHIYRVGQKSKPLLMYEFIASYVRKALLFCTPTRERQHLISSCLCGL